jgi:hypothetical protein
VTADCGDDDARRGASPSMAMRLRTEDELANVTASISPARSRRSPSASGRSGTAARYSVSSRTLAPSASSPSTNSSRAPSARGRSTRWPRMTCAANASTSPSEM